MTEAAQAGSSRLVHSIIRLLIASYFVAGVLGVLSATDMSILAQKALPSPVAIWLTRVVVIGLAVAIVSGWHRRPAALLLATLLFWSSYMTLLDLPLDALSGFWRDLALIGALMLTYADAEARGNDAVAVFRHLPGSRGPRSAIRTAQPQVKPLSRGSVQRAYVVSPAGRAVSRLVRDAEVPGDIVKSSPPA